MEPNTDLLTTVHSLPESLVNKEMVIELQTKLSSMPSDELVELDNNVQKFAKLLGVTIQQIICSAVKIKFERAVLGVMPYYNEAKALACKAVFDKYIECGKRELAWPSGRLNPQSLRQCILQAKKYLLDHLDKDGYYARELFGMTVSMSLGSKVRGVILKYRPTAVGFSGSFKDKVYVINDYQSWRTKLEEFLEQCTESEFIMKQYMFNEDDVKYLKELEQSMGDTFVWNILDSYLKVVNKDHRKLIVNSTNKAQQSLLTAMQDEAKRLGKLAPVKRNTEFDDFEKMFSDEPKQSGGMIE